jgi:surface carbohydrate biosynthesis protein (TIGR04326 family)
MKNYPNLTIQITSDALENILCSFDLVISANSTSASVDAFLAGLPVIIRMDGSSLNLSPLRGQDGVCFVSVVDDFVKAIPAVSNSDTVKIKQDFFWTDLHLPRWKALLNLDEQFNS